MHIIEDLLQGLVSTLNGQFVSFGTFEADETKSIDPRHVGKE